LSAADSIIMMPGAVRIGILDLGIPVAEMRRNLARQPLRPAVQHDDDLPLDVEPLVIVHLAGGSVTP
jgi:hypothetical protein